MRVLHSVHVINTNEKGGYTYFYSKCINFQNNPKIKHTHTSMEELTRIKSSTLGKDSWEGYNGLNGSCIFPYHYLYRPLLKTTTGRMENKAQRVALGKKTEVGDVKTLIEKELMRRQDRIIANMHMSLTFIWSLCALTMDCLHSSVYNPASVCWVTSSNQSPFWYWFSLLQNAGQNLVHYKQPWTLACLHAIWPPKK